MPVNSQAVHSSLTLGLMIPGVCLTGIVLLMYGFLALSPVSREKLDRVSLRLLVYALVAHIVFGSNVLLMTVKAFSDWRCSFIAFITNLSLQFSGGLFFCVAINIPLVLVRNFDGQKTEKYYVLGTALVCAVCNGAAYASGALGWNSSERICWYRNANPAETLRWVVATQTIWILLISVGEVVAFLIVMGYLCAYAHTTRQYRPGSVSHSSTHIAGSKIFLYRSIILRIGIYPLMSAVMNMTGALFDLYVARHPRELDLPVKVADLAIFSARPLVYGLLAATDPSFINAWQALRHRDVPATTSAAPSACMSTIIDMESINSDPGDDPYMQSVSVKDPSLVDVVAVVNVTVIPPRNESPDAGLIPSQVGLRDVARHI